MALVLWIKGNCNFETEAKCKSILCKYSIFPMMSNIAKLQQCNILVFYFSCMKNKVLCFCTVSKLQYISNIAKLNYHLWASLQEFLPSAIQHSYFVKNAMLINSAVSFGLGIRNEEFMCLFFATSFNRYLIYISQFNALLFIQFGKKIHFEMFIWNCGGIFNVTLIVHWSLEADQALTRCA